MNANLLIPLASATESATRSHRRLMALAQSKEEITTAKNDARGFYYWTIRAGILPLLKSVPWNAFDPIRLECSLRQLWDECHPLSDQSPKPLRDVFARIAAIDENLSLIAGFLRNHFNDGKKQTTSTGKSIARRAHGRGAGRGHSQKLKGHGRGSMPFGISARGERSRPLTLL
jgi:hypothetical protein